MEASARLYREPMNDLSFSIGRDTPGSVVADNVAELLTNMNKPIGEVNPWAMLGSAEALLTICVGRIQELEDRNGDGQ